MPIDPLQLVKRPDKWFLANGRGAMFAPAGIQPQPGETLVVQPLPFGLDEFTLDGLRHRGRSVKVTWRASGPESGLRVYVDGTLRAHSESIARIEVPVAP